MSNSERQFSSPSSLRAPAPSTSVAGDSTTTTSSANVTIHPQTLPKAPPTQFVSAPDSINATPENGSTSTNTIHHSTVSVVPTQSESSILPTAPATSAPPFTPPPSDAPRSLSSSSSSLPVATLISPPASTSAPASASVSVSTSPASAEYVNVSITNGNISEESTTNNVASTGRRRTGTLFHRSDPFDLIRNPFSRCGDRVLTGYTLLVIVALVFVVLASDSSNESSDNSKNPNNSLRFSYFRAWFITYATFAIARVAGYIILHSIPPHRLRTFRTIMSWLLCAVHSLIYPWVIVGIVWLHQPHIATSAFIHTVVTAIVIIELVVLSLTVILVVAVFLLALGPAMESRHLLEGASEEQISQLPTVKYVPEQCAVQTCSICLCDYETEDVVRQLPCSSGGHYFHSSCVDKWLMQRKTCPICRENPFNSLTPSSSSQSPENASDLPTLASNV